MKYKKVVFLALFVGALCFLYHPLLCLGMRGAVAFVFADAEKISYEKITWENGRLLLKNLNVQDPAYQMRIDTVSCAFSLSHLSLEIIHPEITVTTLTEGKRKVPSLAALSLIQTKIEHGVLAFKESPRLYFSLGYQESGEQTFKVSYDPHAEPFCEIATQITRHYADVHIDLKEVPSAHLAPLFPLCFKDANYLVNAADGLVSLTGGAVIGNQGDLLSLECVATFQHFKLLEPYLVSAENLNLDFSYLPQEENLPFWKNAKMSLGVQGGSIEVQPGIFLEDIYGNVQGQDSLLFDLVGSIRKDNTQVPFMITGGGHSAEIDVGCVVGDHSTLSCKIALSDKAYHILAHVEGMKGEYGAFLTETPIQGIYQGIVSLTGEGKNLKTIHVQELKAQDVCVGDLVCAQNVSASAKFIYSDAWHLQSSLCTAESCAFHYGQYTGQDLDFTLKWEKDALECLDLTGEICGLRGTIKTSSSEQTSLLDFAFKGSLQKVLSQDLSCEVTGSLFQDVSDPAHPQYDFLGTVACEKEPFEFGASFQKMTFLEGWVQKKGLKTQAFLPFLQPYLPSLNSEGTLDVLASIDGQGCEVICFSPDGMNVSLQGNSLKLPSFDPQKIEPAIFSYDWKERKMRGRVPLKDASLSLGNKGWNLTHFSGDLVVEEGHLAMDQYQASLFGRAIQGQAELFYQTWGRDFLSVLSVRLPAAYPISDLKLSLQYDEKRGAAASLVATEKTVPIATLHGSAEKKDALWNWSVDPSSHILGVILNVETLKTDGVEVEALFLKPTLSCKLIPYGLDFLEKLAVPLDPSFSHEVKSLNLEGMIALNLGYTKTQKWRFQGKGEKLISKGKPLGDVICKGRSDGKTFFIESLEMQNLKLKANITQEQMGYALSSVQGTWEGISFSGKALWNAKEALLLGEGGFVYLDPLQITCKTKENIPFAYSEAQGLKVSGLLCDLYDTPSKAHLGTIRVAESYKLQEKIRCERLEFSVSPTILKRWEGKLPPFLQSVSVEGYVEGEGDLDYNLEGLTFKGSLKNGNYRLGEERLALEKITVTYDHAILGLRFKTNIQELAPLWVEAHINTGEAPYGMIRVTPTLQEPGIKALFKTDKGRCLLDSVKGAAYGVTASLEKSKGSYLPHAHILSGSLAVDFKALKPCFSPEIQKKIQALKLGSGYAFQGDFVFPEGKAMTASGKLFGSHTEFLGFAFETLTAKLLYSPTHIEIADLKLLDRAGTIEMKKMLCDQGTNWSFVIPLLQIKDLTPSALKTVDSPPSSEKPFTITQCLLEGIRGKLADPMTWEGQGMMHFTNTVKKESSFWDAPLDLVRKLGLDPGLLTPICGDIDLKLAGDKLYLDHLKNAYSEGERAQFFLSVDNPSYIDLDGNIRVDIRMRQDVVLRFTEKLLLTIRGTLEKPKYGLQY